MPAILALLGGVPRWLWEGLALIIAVLAIVFFIYRSGEHAAAADAAVALAKHNAARAAEYQREAAQAQKAAADGETRLAAINSENAQLKEKINAVASGNGSPAVDLAVHGVQPSKRPAPRSAGVPRR